MAYWRGQSGLQLRPGATRLAVERREAALGVRFPEALIRLLLEVDGFGAEADQDAEGFTFWPLERLAILSDCDELRGADDPTIPQVVFADYLVMCWGYAIDCNLSSDMYGAIHLVGSSDGKRQLVAENLAEFIDLYIRDNPAIYPSDDPDRG